MKKRAQFYIMAAIILIVAIVGISVAVNYASVKKSPEIFYDLSTQLGEESSRVIEYGIYSESDIPAVIEKFTENFTSYLESFGEKIDLIFVYGNSASAVISTYKLEDSGNITITFPGNEVFIIYGKSRLSKSSFDARAVGNIKVLLDREYEFELKDKENFLFVMQKTEGDEMYVSRK